MGEMKSLKIKATEYTPEIVLSPDENLFVISGRSSPEDVRGLYYPVIEWMEEYAFALKKENPYTEEKPLLLKFDLEYFNSSSAKFLFDIFNVLKELKEEGIPIDIEWYYEEEDVDLREAGEDMALLSSLPFRYCPKTT